MIDWSERQPEQAGIDPALLRRALELVQARQAVTQLCVLRGGQVVLDRAVNCRADSLFWIFSTSKPYLAMLAHQLAERGLVSLDDTVASYWPEFAQRGKDAITIRHVLRHRSGLPVARGPVADALTSTNWDRAVRAVERARPRWPAGEVPAYGVLSFGFILGELVRRVTGTPVRELLGSELLKPLGLHDTHLGLPERLWSRHVPIRGRGPAGRVTQVVLNRRATRRAVVPAGGVSANARDIARFFQMLLCGGELDGVRVLAPATIEQARQPSSDGELDRLIGLPIRWSQGFQLGGPATDTALSRPMGQLSGPLTFGHNGSNCCLAWADPTRQLVFVYLTDQLSAGHAGARHLSQVSDAVIAACTERSPGPLIHDARDQATSAETRSEAPVRR